jgi:toxin ParE1/3/4
MRRFSLHPLASRELASSARYYHHEVPGLGNDFIEEVNAVLNRITAYPESFPLESENVRIARVQRFPFNLLYTVQSTGIFVLAVMHQRRHPDSWKNRL